MTRNNKNRACRQMMGAKMANPLAIREVIIAVLSKCLQFQEDETNETKGIDYADLERILNIIDLLCGYIYSPNRNLKAFKCLEVGIGYGGLIGSLARIFPDLKWYGIEHPDRRYVRENRYVAFLDDIDCQLKKVDIVRETFPFADGFFQFVTFSEILEHLPIESVYPVLQEIYRVLEKSGKLIVSSPNQAAILNRIHLLRGRSILALPVRLEYAGGTYGHIRLYTPEEFVMLASAVGFKVLKITCKDTYLKYVKSDSLIKKIVYKIFLGLGRASVLNFGDTWFALCEKS